MFPYRDMAIKILVTVLLIDCLPLILVLTVFLFQEYISEFSGSAQYILIWFYII